MANDRRKKDFPEGQAPELTTDEARQGTSLGIMRYVLIVSVAIALIGMLVGYLIVT